jgi:hypothetical protein
MFSISGLDWILVFNATFDNISAHGIALTLSIKYAFNKINPIRKT